MAKRKFYVVWEGRQPGIYDNWEDCHEQIDQFPGAKFRSFPTQEEATEAFRADGGETEMLLTHIALRNVEAASAPAPAPAPFAAPTPAPVSAPPVSTSPVSAPVTGPSASSFAAPASSLFEKIEPAPAPAPVPAYTARPRPQANRVDYSRIPEINLAAIAVDGACAGNPGMMEYRGVKVATGEEIFHLGPLPDGTNNVAEYLALIHALALLDRKNDGETPIYTDSATAVAWVRNRGCRTKLTPTAANARIFELIARANVWIQTHRPSNPILRWNTLLWGDIPADFARK